MQEKSKRQRYRGRGTISHMLQDGEKHQVWKPGCHGSSKHKIAESPDQRQQSLIKRINTYRTTSGRGVAEGVVCGGVVGVMASVQKRMKQWQEIEDEARRTEEREAMQPLVGGVAEGRVMVQAYDMVERRESITRRGSVVLSQAMVTIAEEEEGRGGGGRRRSMEGEERKRRGGGEGLVKGEEGESVGEERERMDIDGGKALPLAAPLPEVWKSGAALKPFPEATTGYKDTEV